MDPIPSESVFKKREKSVSNDKCADCNSLCCHDLVMAIDMPKDIDDLNSLIWYLHFESSFIFINDNVWYHMIRSKCRFLSKGTKLCGNYEKRIDKCREHKPPNCERYENWYDVLFDDPYKLEEYVYENKIIKEKSFTKSSNKKNVKKNK